MDLQFLAEHWPNYWNSPWGLGLTAGIIFIFCGLFYVLKKPSKNGKVSRLFTSNNKMKLYQYWRDGHQLLDTQPVDFYMSFETKAKAQEAFFGAGRNFAISEHKIFIRDGRWLLCITINISPSSEDIISEIEDELTRIAEYLDGTYEDWFLR